VARLAILSFLVKKNSVCLNNMEIRLSRGAAWHISMKIVDRLACFSVLSSAALLLFGQTGFAGGSAVQKSSIASGGSLETSLRAVTVISSPTGAQVLINGEYVGTTPLSLEIAVDSKGRCIKALDFRAKRPPPYEGIGIRSFPAAAQDSAASFVPRVIEFDLNVHPMIVLK
jgi:hypothetical protein